MDKNQNKKEILFMPLCVAAGFAIGTSIGVVVDNIPLGICLGMGVGVTSGGLITAILLKKKRQK